MGLTKYKKVIVIGYGTVTVKVLRTVFAKSSRYGYAIQFIEHEPHPFNTAKGFAQDNGIECLVIEDKKILTEHLKKEVGAGPVLVISASNNYIFPKRLLDGGAVDVVNFHNALLPEYPGRNAPSWAIYNREKKTGITWHYVTAEVDAGDIIIQKVCDIPDYIKAYELAAKLMDLAAEAFDEIYESVLSGTASRTVQQGNSRRHLYKSTEVPGDGSFELSDLAENIYRLLRAMDYGKNEIFPLPTTWFSGKRISVKRYRIVETDERIEGGNRIYLPLGNAYLMLRYAYC